MAPQDDPQRADPDEVDSDALEREDGAAAGAAPDLRAQVEEYKARWQRAQADYQNMRRRIAADMEAQLRRTLQPLLEDLLLVLDNLDLALRAPAANPESQSLAAGVRLTRDALVKILADNGVREIPDGGSFDPALHQAVSSVRTADAEPASVLTTVRRGYLWGEGVLRYAQVVVAAAPEKGAGDQSQPR